MGISDSTLIKDCQRGDILAFEQLVKRYRKRVAVFLSRYMSDRRDIDEAVSDTFFKFYTHIDSVNQVKPLAPYLMTVAKNSAHDIFRKHEKTVPLSEYVQSDEESKIFDALVRDETSKRVNTALAALERKYRCVLELYYIRDYSYDAIGSRLGIPVNTVRTHLRRAKKKMIVLLGEYEKNS